MNKSQDGFAHIALIVVFVFALAVVAAFTVGRITSNQESQNNQQGSDVSQHEDAERRASYAGSAPKFDRLPLDPETLDCSPSRSAPPSEAVCVQVFNEERVHNDHTFRTKADTQIYASVEGVVIVVAYQEDSDDYAVHIVPGAKSYDEQTQTPAYIVEYDHFWDPQIKVGDVVSPDTVIGTVPCSSPQRARKTNQTCLERRFELQVNETSDSEKNESGWPASYNVCAYKFFSKNLQAKLDNMLKQHNEAFPLNAYDSWCTGERIPA